MKDRFSGPVNRLQPRFDLKIRVIGNMHMYVYDMLLLLLESSDRKAEPAAPSTEAQGVVHSLSFMRAET